jgi:hypothetical protein
MDTNTKPIIEITDEMMEEGACAMSEAGLHGTDSIFGLDWDGWKDAARDVFKRMLDKAFSNQE